MSPSDTREGFDAFFRREYPTLVALVIALTNDREGARDIAQETMVRAFREWSKVSTFDRPGAWCRHVAINVVRDGWRATSRERAALVRVRGELVPTVPPPAAPTDRFWETVRRLPDRQREAVALYYIADRSVAEIAVAMDVSHNTVKSTLFDARRALGREAGVLDGEVGW